MELVTQAPGSFTCQRHLVRSKITKVMVNGSRSDSMVLPMANTGMPTINQV